MTQRAASKTREKAEASAISSPQKTASVPGEAIAFSDVIAVPPDRVLITPRETAKALKISARTLAYWTAGPSPKIPFVKLGKVKRFVVRDVLRAIDKRRTSAPGFDRQIAA